jgi:hypothetical protein
MYTIIYIIIDIYIYIITGNVYGIQLPMTIKRTSLRQALQDAPDMEAQAEVFKVHW